MRLRTATVFVASALLAACAELAPLREPSRLSWEDPPGRATTRAELVALFGPPHEVLPSELGEVLVYRRPGGFAYNPNRLSRDDPIETRILIYLDHDDRIVKWAKD